MPKRKASYTESRVLLNQSLVTNARPFAAAQARKKAIARLDDELCNRCGCKGGATGNRADDWDSRRAGCKDGWDSRRAGSKNTQRELGGGRGGHDVFLFVSYDFIDIPEKRLCLKRPPRDKHVHMRAPTGGDGEPNAYQRVAGSGVRSGPHGNLWRTLHV